MPLAGCLLIIVNTVVAFDNASHRSDHRSDHRRAQIQAVSDHQARRSQMVAQRSQLVLIAGETPSATYNAELEAEHAKGARILTATADCTELATKTQREFCAGLAKIRGQMAAAEKREQIDGQMADLPAANEAPAAADPYTEAIVSVLAMFRVALPAGSERALVTLKDVLRSLALEVIAAIGPAAWVLVVDGLAKAFSRGQTARARPRGDFRPTAIAGGVGSARPSAAPATMSTSTGDGLEMVTLPQSDTIHKYVAEKLEYHQGATMPAGEAWRLWQGWCSDNGQDQGTQKAFGSKLKLLIPSNKTNNRPIYLNIRARVGKPVLRVVGA
jgi:hypothetical protein